MALARADQTRVASRESRIQQVWLVVLRLTRQARDERKMTGGCRACRAFPSLHKPGSSASMSTFKRSYLKVVLEVKVL